MTGSLLRARVLYPDESNRREVDINEHEAIIVAFANRDLNDAGSAFQSQLGKTLGIVHATAPSFRTNFFKMKR